GVAMCGTGVALQILDYERRDKEIMMQLQQANADRDVARRELENARKSQIKLLIKPEGATLQEMANLQDWECECHLTGEENPRRVDILKGYAGDQFAVSLTDIGKTSVVRTLRLRHVPTMKTWVYSEMFSPLEPALTLKK